jgi:CheY-like chemotaxis protein
MMDLNPGSLHVTNDFRARSGTPQGDWSGPDIRHPMKLTAANQPYTMQGVLAESRWQAEPACSLAPDLPVGRRGRDSRNRTITVLLVDDDATDVIAIRRTFWQLKILNPLIVARNGLEALDILRGDNNHAKLEAPYVILLDLNMPRMGGMELLDALRSDPLLRRTLVFVMTTSAAAADRERAYEKNVVGYIVKPDHAQGFTDTISALESYWRAIEFPD